MDPKKKDDKRKPKPKAKGGASDFIKYAVIAAVFFIGGYFACHLLSEKKK